MKRYRWLKINWKGFARTQPWPGWYSDLLRDLFPTYAEWIESVMGAAPVLRLLHSGRTAPQIRF